MIRNSLFVITSLLTFDAVSAQQCTPNLLVDDFKVANLTQCIECGREPDGTYPQRYFNLIGGDYGAKDITIAYKAAGSGGNMELVSSWGPADTSEDSTHPGAPTAHNYWYVKFDAIACFDLGKYKAIQFDLVAPTGADFYVAMTQKSADCKSRLIDSVYVNLTKYVTPDGTKKTVTMPVSDYATNLLGQPFDLKHLKDFTIVNLLPTAQMFQMSNFQLIGDCSNGSTTGSTTVPTPSGTTTPAASSTNKNSAVGAVPGAAAVVGLLVMAAIWGF